jgi:hypothetical protein
MASAPLGNLFPRITSFSNLLAAFRRAQKGKRFSSDVLAFNAQLEANIFQLQQQLLAFTYAPGAYRRFHIRDPKPRIISAAPYRDRVVHHALCAVIGPPLERRFLATSYANRVGYGREMITCPGTLWLLELIIANGAENGPAIDCFPGDSLLTPLELPLGLLEQEVPGQPQQQRRFPPLSFPPSTLHRQSRWKGFQREHPKGPDPFLRSVRRSAHPRTTAPLV